MEEGVRQMIQAFPRVEGWRSGLLLLLVETERLVEADQLLTELLAMRVLERPKRNEWYALVGALCIAASRTSNQAAGGTLYDVMKPHGNQLALVGYGSYCWGSAEHLLGLCASAAGDLQVAEMHLEAALEANREVGAIASIARVHCDLGRILLRTGRRRDAERHLQTCIDISERIGAARLRSRACLVGNG
jgi:tetratricopeptide (TPR) repeat protein